MVHSPDFFQLLRQGKIKSIPLTQNYQFKPFDCGNEDLNDFLYSDSKVYLRHLRYTTTLIESKNKIIAYYSLSNDLLIVKDKEDFREELEIGGKANIETDFYERFYSQSSYPAAKIGRLAVDSAFQCQGVGSFIIDSLVQSFSYRNKTGCQFITVDAINDHKEQKAIKFYEKHGFKFLTVNDIGNESRAMYKSLIECLVLKKEIEK